MRPTIYLIRHGEKTLDGKKLTKRGILQSKHLAKYLKSEKITKIISSNINRSIQTAKIINKKLRAHHIRDSRIREIHLTSEKTKEFDNEKSRVKNFYEGIIKNNKENILIVSHGNVNRYIICLILNMKFKDIKITQIPTGMNILERKNSGIIGVVAVNDTSHLPKRLKVRQKLW